MPSSPPIQLRLVIERGDIQRDNGQFDFSALDARVDTYTRVGGFRILLDLRSDLPTPESYEPWNVYVRTVSARYQGRVQGYVIGVRPDGGQPPARDFAFFVKTTAINLRVGDGAALIVLGGITRGDGDWLESVYRNDIAAYVDGAGLGSVEPELLNVIQTHDPNASVLLLGAELPREPDDAPRELLLKGLETLGTRVSAMTFKADEAQAKAVIQAMSRLADVFDQELVTLEEDTIDLKFWRGGEDVTAATPHKLLFGLRSLSNYLIYSDAQGDLELTLVDSAGTRPVLRDAVADSRQPVPEFRYDPATSSVRMSLPANNYPVLIDWNVDGSTTFATREDVVTSVLPEVGEIISRHQQAQAAQDAVLSSYIVDALMEQHFRTNAADPGFDVVTENRFFVEGKQTEWEELSFRLNGTRWGTDRPPFPLLQAEKALSLPLDLNLNSDYEYRLEGVERIDGREAFAVKFEPRDATRSFYRGTVWIDRTSYAKVKVQSVQSGLSAPVVSSEEVQYFAPAGTLGERSVLLLHKLVVRQIVLVAGRSLLVERDVRFERFQLNPADFESSRSAARSSERIMYRDTPAGLRYLVKRDGERVVQNEMTTSATAAMTGVTYDPSYDFPLPLAGVNYLDFEFLGKNNQLAVLFAGVLTLVNVQRPSLVGSSVDGSIDLFAIAIKGNDRLYAEGGEIAGTRVQTLPFSTGVNLGWRLGSFHKLVGSYQFRFDAYSRDETTDAAFVPPPSTVTNGLGLAWEWKQRGYSLTVGAVGLRRARWTAWGRPGDYRDEDQDYLKYSASLSKDVFAGFHKLHFNGAFYGGRDLDRFSSYQFGFFDDNRIHGVPSSGVRFEELAMARASYAFNLFDQYRLEVSLDQAMGRSRRTHDNWENVTGLGLGFTTKAWKGTLVRGDLGKSFLPSRYREPGSFVFQLQVLKPL